MDELDESEMPSSQSLGRVIQPVDICIKVTDEELKYRKQLFPDPKSVLDSKVRCTACGTSLLNHLKKGHNLFFHPILQVLVCEDCRAFYNDGIFPLDDDKSDTYCRWCAQGGSLYCCSACNFVFCKTCVRRNFKKSMLEEIEEEDWKCFVCNPESLWLHRAICWASREYIKEYPVNKDDADEVDTSNDERQREKRRAAREKKWGRRGRNVSEDGEHSRRSKNPSRSSHRTAIEISSDDDDDDEKCSTSKRQTRERACRPKKNEVLKHQGRAQKKERKRKDGSDETDGSDDDDRRHKSKRLKERDKGQKHKKGKDVEQSMPSTSQRNASAEESDTEPVGVSSNPVEQEDPDEEARQIAVMQKTCLAMEKLAKDTFAITYSISKKAQQLHAWISKKNKVPDNQLPTTPAKFTKMIKSFEKILCKLSEHTEELQGNVSDAGSEWMNIVEGNQEGETEVIVDKDHDEGEGADVSKLDEKENDVSTLIMADKTGMVNGSLEAPEDVSMEDESAKTCAARSANESDDMVAENRENIDSTSCVEGNAEVETEEKTVENDSVFDSQKSLAVEDTSRVETNGKIGSDNDDNIEGDGEKENLSICQEEENDASPEHKSSPNDTVKNLCPKENDKECKTEDKVPKDKEKAVATKEGKECDTEGHVTGVGESEKTTKVSDEGGVEGNSSLCEGANVEDKSDEAKKDGKDKMGGGEDKSGPCLNNSTQDLFASDEESNINVNEVIVGLDSELNSVEKNAEVENDSVVDDNHIKNTSAEVPKTVSEIGVEQDSDSEDFERTDTKVKPSIDDRNAKMAFLLDTSLSEDNDSDSELASESGKLGKNKFKTVSSDSESDNEVHSGEDVKKGKKKLKGKISTSELLSQYEDMRLNAGCFVLLERLKNQNYEKVDLIDKKTKRDSLMKAISRLGNLASLDKPNTKSSTSGSESDAESDKASVKKRKKKVKKKPISKDSEDDAERVSSDDVNSDIENIGEPSTSDNKSKEKMLNALAAELLANSSNFESSGSDIESQPTKKKAGDENEKKANKKEKNDKKKEKGKVESSSESSSAEQKPVSSKPSWKSDKLLTAKLDETDSDEAEKKWRAKKEREKESSSDSEEDSGSKAYQTRKKAKKHLSDSDSDVLEISSSGKSSDSSDFEVIKKKKRKRKASSDSSTDKSSGSKVKKKKKLRRIKMIDSGSDSEVMCMEDKEEEKEVEEKEVEEKDKDKAGKGRKNIRKVMKGNRLAEETKAAAKDEEERIKRIADRQKLYNEIFTDQQDLKTLDKLVLDFDPDTKKALVSVHPMLVKKLKPHQAEGVKFMWNACFESLKRIEEYEGSGCILAHCMGLGKTLQVIALVHALLTNPKTKVRTVLVICPLNTVLNWVNEFNLWLNDLGSGEDVEVFELSKYKANVERMYQLKDWQKAGGVMILGYEMYRNLSNCTKKNIRQRFQEVFKSSLVDPGPDLVICDEGHLLKNLQSALSKAVNSIKTARRIVLTGTPLQNNLKEYHCMIQFVKPNLLGSHKEFLNRFVNPITNGQLAESTPHDVRVMKRRAHVLHKMLEGCVQRRDYLVLTPFLPPKYEFVIGIQLTALQSKLYLHYLENFAKMKGGTTLFNDFQNLQRIWTHPRLLKIKADNKEKKRLMESDSEGSLRDFICDDSTSSVTSYESSDSAKKKKKGKKKKSSSSSGSSSESDIVCISDGDKEKSKESKDENEKEIEEVPSSSKEWWENFVVPEDYEILEHSGKLVLLFDILQKCELIGDKVLVFSQSLMSLDVIEHFLENIDDLTQSIGTETLEDSENPEKKLKFLGSWAKGLDYFRIDGSVSPENRSVWCKQFNRETNLRARLFLISTRAGGMGINLIGANRVILFDASWNPSNDLQSIFRIYRFGQTKPCYVYRFLAQGTMEEKIYNRQVTKLSLALRVVDEHQIERHFNLDDLQELYRYDPNVKTKRPTPMLPKDRLLAELIQKYPDLIDNYHEHDSLLENKTEEELTEEERKAAWEDFENDKKGVLPTNNLPGGAMVYGGMIPQMMYGNDMFPENARAMREAILEMHPNATEEQIAAELSLTASRISQYFANTAYPQVQPYYNTTAPQMLTRPTLNMYSAQGVRYPQQMPILSNQYGLQNYYHNPVVPSSLTNQERIITPVVANTSQRMPQPASIQPMPLQNLQRASFPQATKAAAPSAAPKLKVRRDLMPSSGDHDIIIE